MKLTMKWHYCRNALHCKCLEGSNCKYFHPKLCNLKYNDSLKDEGIVEDNSVQLYDSRFGWDIELDELMI